jgi:ABC-type Co2+ transport system permease subunit
VIEFIVSKFHAIMKQAIDRYDVNPAIFLAIYLISVPFFYYSLVRMMRAIAKKRGNEVLVWSTVFLCTIVAPFIYVLFFGRNLPWWVYGIIALLIGQGIFSLIRKLRSSKKATPSTP